MALKIYPPEVNFKGCSLITGFHGIGATGYWSVKYLIQKLKAERVAFIESELSPPVTSTSDGRLVTPYEIFRSKDLAFFKVETPPYKGSEVEFFRSFSEWVVDAGFMEAVLIGGLDSSLRGDESTFRVVHTKAHKPEGEFARAQVLEDDHIIVGPVAVMLNYFEIHNFPAIAVLSYASTERIDPRAAAAAISVLSKNYNFEIDVSPLIRGAEALEFEVAKEETRLKKSGDSIYT